MFSYLGDLAQYYWEVRNHIWGIWVGYRSSKEAL